MATWITVERDGTTLATTKRGRHVYNRKVDAKRVAAQRARTAVAQGRGWCVPTVTEYLSHEGYDFISAVFPTSPRQDFGVEPTRRVSR